MNRLERKLAFVTAAGAGIGRATALAFSREGAKVVATDIDEAALAKLKSQSPQIETACLDVTDRDAIVNAAGQWTDVDILFNAAGWVANGSILDCDEDQWHRTFQINVTSMYRTSRAFLPNMLRRKAGAIVNIASVASSITGVPNRFSYGASKAAVIGLTKAIAADYVASGVRCNAICPGTVETPSLLQRMAETGDAEAARVAFVSRQPMARLGTAEEIADLAVYLSSDEASFTTGQAYIIDGGWTN